MNTIPTRQNNMTVFIPDGAKELQERRLELELMTDIEPEVYAALWEALADDYDQMYPRGILAARCRARAAHYRGLV